jgi:hypothetical protein
VPRAAAAGVVFTGGIPLRVPPVREFFRLEKLLVGKLFLGQEEADFLHWKA